VHKLRTDNSAEPENSIFFRKVVASSKLMAFPPRLPALMAFPPHLPALMASFLVVFLTDVETYVGCPVVPVFSAIFKQKFHH
jgi:hypothetical protein